jgi:hypothetical protein
VNLAEKVHRARQECGEQLTAAEVLSVLALLAQTCSVYLLYWHKRAQFTCFTGTNVLSLLALLAQMCSVYLLYWHKCGEQLTAAEMPSLLALLAQTYKY